MKHVVLNIFTITELTKCKRLQLVFIKIVTNVNVLLNNIKIVNPGEFSHSANNNQLKLLFKSLDGYRKQPLRQLVPKTRPTAIPHNEDETY